MKKFTILVDMDDTLVETVRTWIHWLNVKHNLSVKYEDIKCWDMQVAFPSLTLDQIRAPLMNEHFWMLVKPKPDAVEYLKKLMDDGHKVIICSASHPYTITAKIKYCLFKYFDYLQTEQLMFTYKKQIVNADFCIDDGIHNLIDAPYRGILISTPYNEAIEETEYEKTIVSVNSFKEAYEYVKEEAERFDLFMG